MSDSNHSDPDAGGDWFEITNTGSSAVDVADYSFDDDSATAGASGPFPPYSLAPGASMIILDDVSEQPFRTLWNLDAGIKIISNSSLSNFSGFGKGGDGVFLFDDGGGQIDSYTFGAATEGFSFARFTDRTPVPGGLSRDGLFGAYESDDPSEDVASPGLAQGLPDPLPPFFTAPFTTAGLANSNLSVSEYRIRSIDPNPGDTITLSATETPAWLTLTDLGGGLASLGGTPPTSAIGTHEFEVTATDNTNRSSSQAYRINVLPSSSPLILNEYNAVAADEFLDGGDKDDVDAPADPRLGRILGNGGPWVEFVVTQTTDLRGWTLEIKNEDDTRTLKLSDHIALSAIPAGTILTFTESKATSPTAFNITSALNTSGYTWSNIWMHDSILIDQDNSTHPPIAAINSSDTSFTWSNATDDITYGPSGESIALKDSNGNGIGDDPVSVGGTEVFKLERDPASNVTPLDVNYDDSGTSTFGSPNKWTDNTITQSFAAFVAPTPPHFTLLPPSKAIRGTYVALIADVGAPLSVIKAPDFLRFLTVEEGGGTAISNKRPLTFNDIGKYEISLSAIVGGATGYLVYELEVLNPAPALVLNEYNAVDPDKFLNGGILVADGDGGDASADSHFARLAGNGGNWFELALVGDGGPGFTDLNGWSIEVGRIANSGKFVTTSSIGLISELSIWTDVPHGTILTFVDNNTAAGGLDTEVNRVDELTTQGYAWTNVYLGDPAVVIVNNPTKLAIDSNNTAFLIKDASGTIIFGPAGEGIAPLDGVGSTEIFELENDPSTSISSCDDSSDSQLGYDDGSSSSTFGSPNLFAPLGAAVDRAQDFSPFILTPFQVYLASIGFPNGNPTADTDRDGFSNLDEYLLGGDLLDASVFPQTSIDPITGTVTTNVRVNDPNFVLIPQRSPDLLNWVSNELLVEDEASPLGADFLLRNFTYDGAGTRMFFRVATQPAD
jgi:hypothetical protein